MRITTKGLAQATGLVVGIAFMGFAVSALDLTAMAKTSSSNAAQSSSAWSPRSVASVTNGASENALRIHITARVEAFRTAMVDGDVLTLETLTDEALSFGHSNGNIQSKDDFLEMIRSGSEVFKTLDLVDRNLEISGRTAIERHVFNSDILIDGKLITVSLGILEVWRNNGGIWQLVARQAYKI